MTRLVQVSNGHSRRVAVVEEPYLRCLREVQSVYELALRCLRNGRKLGEDISTLALGKMLDYNDVYNGATEWHLLAPIDVPGAPSRLTISGTGLTHLGSAKDRQTMHAAGAKKAEETAEAITDSMRMFRSGVEGGRPQIGEIGIAPEWFYKGSGLALRGPFEPLPVPAYAEDGGEEAEIAGIYIVADDGVPYRIGMAAGNEFSDHLFERRNYLNLAGSKLRACSVGPEIAIDAEFHAVMGEVRILRGSQTVWSKDIETGEENMCHSLANIEHHHFKFEGHRQAGDVHVHFYGAHSLSFGSNIALQDGDWMEVRFDGFGRALRNPLHIEPKETNHLVRVRSLA
ncbi:MAG TPA: AraD1 family protein [Terracidiphilus sp.]|nr:AraD1 family protein [Terracidiphilus sp.]